MENKRPKSNTPVNSDAVPEGTPGAAENICRRCSGTGRISDGQCPECGGTGKVLTPVGGAG
jgi:DnaJ-class molecular chaperone